MNLKNNFKEVLFLAFSVGLLVTTWGLFHLKIGVLLAWPAFVSAALFFAMGHHTKDAAKVIVGLLMGVVWGILFYGLFEYLAQYQLPGILAPMIVLSVLSISAVLITHLGIHIISHLPSLFAGWAVAVNTLSGLRHEQFLKTSADTFASLAMGIVVLGVGIPFVHGVLKGEKTKQDSNIKKKQAKPIDDKSKPDRVAKIQNYINPYRLEDQNHNESAESKLSEDLADIRSEIIKLSNYFPASKSKNISMGHHQKVSIVGICGSPHKKGSTIVYLQRILDAAASMGHVDTHLITIAGKNIKPCMGCKTNKCHGECIIKDDMQNIYPVLKEADGIIIGSPSYFGTFSGQLKILIDRLRVMRHTDFQLANKVIAPLGVAGRRHGGQEITNLDIIQAMMRHNTIIVNDGTAVCQLGATGWSHTFDDPNSSVADDEYGLQTCEGVGIKVVEIARAIKSSGLQQNKYNYNAEIGKR